MNEGLYRTKPAAQRLVRPLVDACVSRGVRADVVTLAAVPVAALGGVCLALSGAVPVLLLVVPVLAAVRLILNLIDGQVARRTGTSHPWGEVLNELGDRVADVLFIGGLTFVAAVGPLLALGAVTAAVLASYAGVVARAVGASRQYGGVMSKPGRMTVLAVTAPLALVLADDWPLVAGAWLILAGSLLTLAQRLRSTRRRLDVTHATEIDARDGEARRTEGASAEGGERR
jgi:CDP-diacylglycerol---glycerol-3-phosphate 3-phosphatidyltransferase